MQMIANPSDLAVNLNDCLQYNCLENCGQPECELCLNCLDNEQIAEIREAYREHTRSGGFKRVFPSKLYPTAETLTKKSNFVAKWILAKCQIDKTWC